MHSERYAAQYHVLSLRAIAGALLSFCFCLACGHSSIAPVTEIGGGPPTLTLISTGQNAADVAFLSKAMLAYKAQTEIQVNSVAGYDSVNTRLGLLRSLFAKRSPDPDICEIDNIWPALLSDDLLDLKPYLGDELTAIDKSLLDAFTINNRVVALPEFVENPVLYYRADLLKKYGYRQPPRTWDELTGMAAAIQAGERKAGASNFWGYVWQGAEGESLNCNALEWQHAEGPDLIDSSGKVCAFNPAAERALRRARSWVGTISPASVVEYDEDDTANVWLAGSAVFARDWMTLYQPSKSSPILSGKFAVAPLPAGGRGSAWTFGGMGFAVSRFSDHPKEAANVIRFLVSSSVQRQRLAASLTVPSRSSLLDDPGLLKDTAYSGWLGQHWRQGMFSRPSAITGKKYDSVSSAYSKAVHDVISGKQDPHQALIRMQAELTSILQH